MLEKEWKRRVEKEVLPRILRLELQGRIQELMKEVLQILLLGQIGACK
jgi:hypothetical protein